MMRSASAPRLALAIGIALVAGTSATRGQDPPRTPYIPRDTTVRISAIVTDATGRPIAGLQREDFELIDSGTALAIDTVEFRSGGASPTHAAAPAASPLDQPRAGESGRLLALFLDEYHVSAGENTLRAREALARFVDEQLRPDDLVAIMKPLDSVVSIRLTRNRDELRAAIERFTGCKGDYTPRSPFEANVISQAPAAAAAARAQVVMSALNALATHLGTQREGRKALLLVSEGFSADGVRHRVRLPDTQSIVRAAHRFDVAIYAFNPAAAAADGADAGPVKVLQTVAEQTSGEAALSAGELDAGLRRVTRDLDAYYALTFRPANGGDGRLHPIELRVKRKGARVRARSGYWTASIDELRRARLALTPPAPVFRPRPQKISPLVQPWIRMTRAPGGKTRVQFMWEPKAGSAAARRTQAAVGALVLTATAADGISVFNGRVSPARGGIAAAAPTRAVLDAAPGTLALEMSIEDINDTVLDTDARTIIVPDFHGTRTMLGTPEVVRTRTAVEFRTAAADPQAVPTATRVFSRSERLLIRVPGYGPRGADAVVTARLLNALGQPMRDLPAAPPAAIEGLAQFDLLLANLPAGEYRIELTARSGDADVREAFAIRVTS